MAIFQAAARWTLEALRINVMDADLHAWRGEALAELKTRRQSGRGVCGRHRLEPEDAKLRFSLAECYVDVQEPAKAKSCAGGVAKTRAGSPGGDDLLEKIK